MKLPPKADALAAMLEELDSDINHARCESKSSQGLAQLVRIKVAVLDALYAEVEKDRAMKAAEDEAARPISDEDLIAAAVADLAALPDALLDRVLDGLVHAGRGAAVRRSAPPGLRIVGD
jgi:hypothetical protein